MNIKRAVTVAALAIVVATCASIVQASTILYGSYLSPKHSNNKYGLQSFFKAAKAEAPELNFNFLPGGAIVGAKTTLTSIRDGVVDAGHVTTLYHPNDLPINTVITDLAVWGDNAAANAGAANETLLLKCPECLAEWEQWNIKNFGAYSTSGFRLLCTKPIKSLEDLAGKKVRGAGAFGRWINALGAIPVNVPVTEVFEGLQRGQIDCTLGSVGWMKSFSFWDVTKYIFDVPSGAYFGGSLVNLSTAKWAELSDKEKQAYINAAPAGVRGAVVDGYLADDIRAAKRFKEKGVQIFKPDHSVLKTLEQQRQKEIAIAIEKAKKRGVKDPERIVKVFLESLKKWEKIVSDINGDPDKYEDALRREIYSKVTF